MGAVFRPKDLPSGRKRMIENAVRDFSPNVKDDVVKILESWEKTGSTRSEEKIKKILGQDRAESLFKKIRARKNEITYDEQKKLQDMFKESLTFD
jgi:DNA-directed RNA polymerase subunit F